MGKAEEYLQAGIFKDLHDSEVPYIDWESGVYDGHTIQPILNALRIAYLEGALEWMSPYDTGCAKDCREYLREYKELTGEEFPESPLYLDDK